MSLFKHKSKGLIDEDSVRKNEQESASERLSKVQDDLNKITTEIGEIKEQVNET